MSMKSKAIFVILMSLNAVSVNLAAAEAARFEHFRYISLPSGSTVQLDVKKSRIVFDEHSVIGAKECTGLSEFHCLVGGDAFFVFPKRALSEQSTWEYSGQKFAVQKRVNSQVFGKKYSAFLIARQDKSDSYWYLYSPRDGLLAFGLTGQNVQSNFFIDGRCGFGAHESCR